jgi:lipopolysaccharide export system protein LptA
VTGAFITLRRIWAAVAAVVLVAGAFATQGWAQPERGGPRLFKNSPQQQQQPVRITSVSLEVRDREKKATFTGEVQVVQGDSDLRCSVLVVFYENDDQGAAGASAKKKAPAPATQSDRGNQKIKRMEAKGAVVMTQKDQRAVGDHADFDVINNTMVLTGDVVVTRGEDILRGRRLNVNMTTGIYTMETDGGRVEMLVKSKGAGAPQLPPRSGRSN